jgi:hypothetical protein
MMIEMAAKGKSDAQKKCRFLEGALKISWLSFVSHVLCHTPIHLPKRMTIGNSSKNQTSTSFNCNKTRKR